MVRHLAAALALTALATPAFSQQVFINEVLASNQATLEDPDYGDYSDWIELRNATDAPADLSGFFLTDDLDEPQKWHIPSGTVIPAGGFLLIWADGQDAAPPATSALHASFKLSAKGESVALFRPDGVLVDSMTFGQQTTDVSYGRLSTRPETWASFGTPTPSAPNATPAGSGVASVPTATHASGFYEAGTVTNFAAEAGAVVRFTRDGSLPTESSEAWRAPSALSETTVIRAAAFAEGAVPSAVVTRTYFVGEAAASYSPRLPVISLVAEPDDFFSDERGIYVEGTNGGEARCRAEPANWWQKDWERPVHVTFFEPGEAGAFSAALDHGAGAKIFGGCSRNHPQKSLVLHARARYGASKFEHAVFPSRDVDEYDDLVLRNSGNDWLFTMLRGGMIETLTQHLDLDGRAYRPAVVFINGEFFGLHNLREKLNKDYLAGRYGTEKDAVTILEPNTEIDLLSDEHYARLAAILETSDLETPGTYEEVDAMMDIDQFLDYQIAQIYIGNNDWPGNNMKLWRPHHEEGRWRWMLFDTDYGFGGFYGPSFDALAHATAPDQTWWPNPMWATLPLRALLQHDSLRHTFIQRFAAHMATTFEPGRITALLDSLAARIEPVMARHQARWPTSVAFNGDWAFDLNVVRDYARDRPAFMRAHVERYFGEVTIGEPPYYDEVSGTQPLALSAQPGGTVRMAGVAMRGVGDGLHVDVFEGVPARFEALAEPGYVFTGWQGTAAPRHPAVPAFDLDLYAAADLRATFARGSGVGDDPALAFALGAPYPSPASVRSQVSVTLPHPAEISLHVYDLLGRRVQTLAEGAEPTGTHAFDIRLGDLASGVYAVVLRAPGFSDARTLVVAR